MRQAKYTGVILAAVLLTLFCGCGNTPASDAEASGAASSSASAASETPVLYCGEIELHWEIPQYEYTILDTAAGEDGIAVLYTEWRSWNGNPDDEPHLYVMAQLFDAKGNHTKTAYTGVRYDLDESIDLTGLWLADKTLYYTENGTYHYSMETATGYVDEWCYEPLLEQDGAVLAYSSIFRETPYTLGMRFCLTDDAGDAREIVIREFDENFGMALDFLISGEEHDDLPETVYTALVSLDAAAKTAVVSNTKLTYTLNFNDLSYTCTRRYTDEMLGNVLAISPNGARTLRLADAGGQGDALWWDVVLIGQDGSANFLCHSGAPYDAAFLDDDTVLLNLTDELLAYDLKQNPPAAASLIDLGSATEADGDIHPERLVVGMAFDRDNQLLLVATRDYTEDWDALLPVTLTVFDASLLQTDEIKTDCRIMPYSNNWTMPCDITLNGDGTAALSWYRMKEDPVRVRYLD